MSSIFAVLIEGKKKGCLEKDNPGNSFKKMRKITFVLKLLV